MRTTFLLAVALVSIGLTNIARGADMPVKAPTLPPVVSGWAGFYAGVNAGYGWGQSRNDWDLFAPGGAPFGNTNACPPPGSNTGLCVSGSDRTRFQGALGGLQAGYNWISGKALLGLEADVQYANQRADNTFNGTWLSNAGNANGPFHGQFFSNYSESLRWLGTFRGRAGLINDGWAVYGTGGLAVGEVNIAGTGNAVTLTSISSGNPNCSPFDAGPALAGFVSSCRIGAFSHQETRIGWTLGVGTEVMLAGNWSLKAEYLHVDLGSVRTSFSTAPGCYGGFIVQVSAFCQTYGPGNGSVKASITDEIVRVGVNYHFGGPIVAKY